MQREVERIQRAEQAALAAKVVATVERLQAEHLRLMAICEDKGLWSEARANLEDWGKTFGAYKDSTAIDLSVIHQLSDRERAEARKLAALVMERDQAALPTGGKIVQPMPVPEARSTHDVCAGGARTGAGDAEAVHDQTREHVRSDGGADMPACAASEQGATCALPDWAAEAARAQGARVDAMILNTIQEQTAACAPPERAAGNDLGLAGCTVNVQPAHDQGEINRENTP